MLDYQDVYIMKKIFLLISAILLAFPSFSQSYAEQVLAARKLKEQEFVKNPMGPVHADQVKYLNYYPVDEKYKVNAKVEILFNEPTFRMPTYDGTSNEYKRYAVLKFNMDGQPYELTAYQSAALFKNPAYQNHLFVPFLDATNGDDTYAGGRYMDLSSADIKGGNILIDFNLAYNPYCAYSNGYRCPVPPQENFLNLAILAGEKAYLGPKNERTVNKSIKNSFSASESTLILEADSTQLMRVLLTTSKADSIILREPATDIAYDDPLVSVLASRMLATVQDPQKAGVGIAAPQVGVSKNLIWVQRFDKKGEPFEFYINPKIIWRSKLTRKGAEGCLSIPDRREDVLRSYAIRLQYVDRQGHLIEENVEGFTAVIFQHEVDHLYGILYPDRLEEQQKATYLPLNDKIEFSISSDILRP